MSDIRIDDDGFLVGDTEQQRTEAESVLMQDIKTDTTAIVNLLKGTVKLQRDALKAAQSAASPKPKGGNNNANSGAPSRVNLVHPNRAAPTPTPNNAPIPPTVRPNRQGAGGNPTPTPTPNNGANAGSPPDTARPNRQRGANGRFTSEGAPSDSSGAPASGNRDSRGRFTGGNGANAAERSATSRITDGLKDLNNTLTVNANTDRIDPMVDAIKEAGSVITTGVEAGKKVLSVGNTLIAKPAMALGRGIKGLIKPKTDTINSPVAWYKRIWRTLERGNRQDQTQHNQEQRRLDELVRGQGQGGGSGNSGLLLMLGLGLSALLAALKKGGDLFNNLIPDFFKKQDNQSPVPVVGKIPKLPVTALPPTRTQALLGRLGETKIGKALGAFSKRLPFISSALEAGAGAINAVNIDNDQNLTDEQKQRKQAQNAGATAGAIGGGLGGAAVGAMVGSVVPVVGTIIGGIVGAWLGTDGGRIVGDKIGGWVDDLRKVDIAGRISNAWNGLITPFAPMFTEIKAYALGRFDAVGKVWDSFVVDTKMRFGGIMAGLQAVADFFKQVGDFWGGVADAANTWIKQKTGIDVKDNLKRSKNAVNDYAGQKLDQAGQFVDDVGQSVKNTPLVQGVMGLWNGLTGETEKEKQARLKNSKGNKSKQAAYNQVKPLIGEAAKRFNVSEKMLTGFAGQESGFMGGGLKNKDSTATGLFQFVEDTWADQIARSNQPEALPYKADAQAYLNDKQQGLSREKRREKYKTLLAARNDNKLNAIMGAQYSRYAIDALAKKGVFNPTIEEVYTYHHDGNTKAVAKARKGDADSQAHVKNLGSRLPDDIAYYKPNTPTNTVPTIKTAPVNAASSPSVQSVPSVQAQESPRRLDNTPTPIKVSMPKPLVGQNISDRGIAHILTGGIGEMV